MSSSDSVAAINSSYGVIAVMADTTVILSDNTRWHHTLTISCQQRDHHSLLTNNNLRLERTVIYGDVNQWPALLQINSFMIVNWLFLIHIKAVLYDEVDASSHYDKDPSG